MSDVAPKPDFSIYSHVYHKQYHFAYEVTSFSTLEDLKFCICNMWSWLTPSTILVNYFQNQAIVPILADVTLQGIYALHSSKQSAFFDLRVDVISNGASRRMEVDSNADLVVSAKNSYLKEGKEAPRVFFSDGWDNIFDDTDQLFYGGVDAVRIACKKYCMRTGYEVIKKKNDLERFTAVCSVKGCSWKIHATAIGSSIDVFKIKEYVGRHTCGGGYMLKNPRVTKKLMNSLIHEMVRHNPRITPAEIIDYLKVGGGIEIQYHHAYHAIELSHKQIFGNDVKSCTDLAWWVNAVRETNPGSFIDFDFNDATKRFNRLFICFGACIEGYKLCRPMIFCDCTFLTGTFKGGLMAATCLNGNQGFYPLAFALVPGEDNISWEWFFKKLKEALNDDRPITFMTDRGEGLVKYIPKEFPDSHQRYCYFHLNKNLPIAKSDEKYKEVTDAFRKATYALSPATYEEGLQEMVNLGRPWVDDYCRNIPKEKWSSAFFKGCSYGYTSSSVAESFNSWINKEKKLPACAFVDSIRIRMMEMMSERREESLLMDPELLTPTYQALLEIHIQIGRPWKVSQSAANRYEVHSPRSHMVDIERKTCTFQRWRVYGFPCSRATAAITRSGERILDYVEDYFKVTTFRKLYSISIRPVPNHDRPDEYHVDDIVLPAEVIRSPPGRKKGKRIKSTYETSRKSVKCSNCNLKTHHNKATCNLIRQYELSEE